MDLAEAIRAIERRHAFSSGAMPAAPRFCETSFADREQSFSGRPPSRPSSEEMDESIRLLSCSGRRPGRPSSELPPALITGTSGQLPPRALGQLSLGALEKFFPEAFGRMHRPAQDQQPYQPVRSPFADWLGHAGRRVDIPTPGLHEWYGWGDERSSSDDRLTARRYGKRHLSGRHYNSRHYNSRHYNSRWTPPLAMPLGIFRRLAATMTARWIVWVGRRCFPYPAALVNETIAGGATSLSNEIDPPPLWQRSLFVQEKNSSAGANMDRLWAADLALRCDAVGAVLADGSGFDMAATCRLQVVAASQGKPIFLVRPPWERSVLSAAHSRWHVRPAAGAADQPDDHRQTGVHPQWLVTLHRCKGVSPGVCPCSWMMEWDRGTGSVHLSAVLADHAASTAAEVGDIADQQRRTA